tara:strand:+ start:227 stop:640 length:414 start_codon:yes stop_codon:yes gene_type:complete
MKELIRINHAEFWTENGILYCNFNNSNPNYTLDSDRVKLYIDAIVKLCKGKPMPFVYDITNSKGTYSTSAAHLFANSPSLVKLRISEAFVLNTIGIKLLIHSYKRLYDTKTPYKIFNNMNDALSYCVESKNKFYGSN